MLVIGLTGGIGSGKTAVGDLFAKLGVPVIDADVIARELTEPNQPALVDIIDHFPQEILLEDGRLNRPKLRQIIFEHPHEKRWLEQLLHPLIREEIKKRIEKLSAPYCVIVIPLLFETGAYPFIDRILVVDAAVDDQVNRVVKRDSTTSQAVEAILASQAERDVRLAGAHDVIMNDGVLDELDEKVSLQHARYLELAGLER